MTNSNGKAPANDGFGSSMKPKPLAPPEAVRLDVLQNQIVVAVIPHNTAKAAPIRTWMHQNVIHPNDRHRLFIFRTSTNNSWTTIALDSTPAEPKLTAEPAVVVTVARAEFNRCPHVSTVSCRDWMGNEITEADIPNLQFNPLMPAAAPEPVAPEPVITAMDINAQLTSFRTDQDDKWLANNREGVQREARIIARFDQLDARFIQFENNITSAIDRRLNAMYQLGTQLSKADSVAGPSTETIDIASGSDPAVVNTPRSNAGKKPDTVATRKVKGKRRVNDNDDDN